jgi:6-phosphogluconolactonase
VPHHCCSIATDVPGIPMTSEIIEHYFASRDEASVAAAQHIAAALRTQLNAQDDAALIVTGGSSPARCYSELAASGLEWSHVHVLLSDERWVPASDDNSNEKLVRETLLINAAEEADLVPIYSADTTAVARCLELNELLPAMPLPFACSLLGMGEDGHVASLFADAENLAAGLDVNGADWCIPVSTAASPHPRVSLTMRALLNSEQIVLLFFGESKRDLYEQAKSTPDALPVSTLLSQERTPVHVFWAA